MSRQINWDEELSDEDRAWAQQRGDQQWDGKSFNERIAENDEQFGKEAKTNRMSRSERMADLRSTIADSQNELARLEQEQADEDNANKALAGSVGDQAAGLLVTDNTPVNGEQPVGSPATKDDYSDTNKWNVPSLKTEIDKRNEERAKDNLELLHKSGTRAELVERLRQDDAELAAGE